MSTAFLSDPTPYTSHYEATVVSPGDSFPVSKVAAKRGWLQGLSRRWRRERRRRKVGRAYDMALEIARFIPRDSSVLDVGCGNGYIAQHLSALLGSRVLGIDLNDGAEAPIDFKRFDGNQFPADDRSFDATLFCYVLHHAQDLDVIMKELRRVLRSGGTVLVYEDVPACWWDRIVCRIHDLKWRKRTGPCTFRTASQWRSVFVKNAFEIVLEKRLSRGRNMAHPVARRLYVLKRQEKSGKREVLRTALHKKLKDEIREAVAVA
jgi:SAM-dependent methyltransferase